MSPRPRADVAACAHDEIRVMTREARRAGAINLAQGVGELPVLPQAVDAAVAALREGQHGYSIREGRAELREVNFDHPDAFDTELMVRHISELKAGRAIEKPIYDFVAYARRPETKLIQPADVVIIEGILVLHLQPVRELCGVKIFVDAEDDVRIIRRLIRDIKDRGRDFDRVVEQYFRSVRPMHMGFVEPSKRHADIIVPQGGDNEVAIRMLVDAIRARLGQRSPPPRS